MQQPSEATRRKWGAAIAAARAAKDPKWSQVDLAVKAHLHPQTISEYERGGVMGGGSEATRARIADALGVDVADLFASDEAVAS